jgi:hypothetical protein
LHAAGYWLSADIVLGDLLDTAPELGTLPSTFEAVIDLEEALAKRTVFDILLQRKPRGSQRALLLALQVASSIAARISDIHLASDDTLRKRLRKYKSGGILLTEKWQTRIGRDCARSSPTCRKTC